MSRDEMKESYEKFIEAVLQMGLQEIDGGKVDAANVYDHAIKVIQNLVFDHVHTQISKDN